jgi:FixJ family two-component response regulator
MMDQVPIIIVVDDDASFRHSSERLLKSVGFEVQTFSSPEPFLASIRPDAPTCVLLDIRMPGMSGLEVQRWLLQAGRKLPLIFVSGHADIPMSVQAMKYGAVDFLTKPVREPVLLEAIAQAIARDRSTRLEQIQLMEFAERFHLLSARERQVIRLIVTGMLNKLVASQLGITEATVKLHRRNVMLKMRARSLPQLVLMTEQLRLAGMI